MIEIRCKIEKNMKILLAAGVFYPDVGGPAIHVRKIAERFMEEGFDVQVISYGDDNSNTPFNFRVSRVSRKLPKLIQWISYLALVFYHGLDSRVIYALDPTAAGLPARIVSLILSKSFVIRVGGDPIWEREAEMGRRLLPMDDYYKQGLYAVDRPILFRIIRWVIRGASTMIVYNQNFKDFYNKYFGIDESKIIIIKNPVFKRESASEYLLEEPVVMFAGRLVSYKNLPRVMRAISNLPKGKLLIVGTGPEKDNLIDLSRSLSITNRIQFVNSLPQEKLFELIRSSSVCIAPAFSEFNPNFILEALSLGKPVLISKGHGLSVDIPKELEFNPLDETDIESKLAYVLSENNYPKIIHEINNLELNRTWDEVTNSHLSIIKKLL